MYDLLRPFLRLLETPRPEPANALALSLADVFDVDQVRLEDGGVYAFYGHLRYAAEDVFPLIRARFEERGFTPMLRRVDGREVVIAMPGVIQPRPVNVTLNILLFLATVGTTMWAGSFLAAPPASPLDVFNPLRLIRGLPFALALLSILGIHELGHYIMARYHGADVTPPYFIPVPFGLGTFGAFIQLRSPVEDRRALFDVGLAGPLAGFVVALPLMALGLALSEVVPKTGHAMAAPLLVRWLGQLIRPHAPGEAVRLHPIGFAAYIGLWITAMNLLPVGQLDGGHVVYSVVGSIFRHVAWVTLLMMLIMGLTLWEGWLVWALFVALTGLNHPPPLNDITPLDRKRYVWFGIGVTIFVLTFLPRPF